jgi:ABC-2 type transport system permease protein
VISYDLLKPIMGEYTVRYLIPFEYFSSEFIVKYAAYEAPFIITTILVIVISLATSYFLYARKDVQAS